jgi:WD40 repeat protein
MSLRNLRRWPICLLGCLSLAWGQASASGPADEPPAPTPQPPLELTVQTGHTAEIHALEYASNGKFFVTAGKDSTIKLWSPEGTLIRTIRTGFWVDYLALSRDNQLLLVAPRVGERSFYSRWMAA